jgi:hypothetical protein
MPFKGKVEAVTGLNSIQVIEDGFYSVHDDAPFHPRQLVRLRPKQVKGKEAREFWVTPRNIEDAVKEIENEKECSWAAIVFDASLEKQGGDEVCLREVRKGDLITSEEELAMAWNINCYNHGLTRADISDAFNGLLRTLKERSGG